MFEMFPCEGIREPTDYSGIDRHDWGARTISNYLKALEEIIAVTALAEKTGLQRNIRLCRLPYFDIT